MTKTIVLETARKQSLNNNTEQNVENNMEQAIEATGYGKFNYLITITGGLILYSVNSELWSTGYLILPAECDMNLNLEQKTILVTINAVGVLTTQFFWGFISDRIGRRNVMLYTLALGCLFTILSFLSPVFWMMSLFRFLNGTCVACSSGLIYAYAGEFFSAHNRSVFLSIISIFIGIVLTLIPLTAYLIIPLDISFTIFGYNYTSWRLFLLLTGLPAILACISLYFCPESPKFLAQAQRNDECLQVLRKMHKMNGCQGTYPIEKVSCGSPTTHNVNILQLFSWKYLWKTLLVCTLQGGIIATSGGLFLWYPDIQQRILKSTEEITACQALNLDRKVLQSNANQTNSCAGQVDNSVYFQNIIIGGAYTVGYIIICLTISKVGIKKLLVLCLSLAGFSGSALHFVVNKLVIDILFLAMMVLSGVCIVVVNAAVVEIYPTELRGLAVCTGMLAGRLGSIVSSSVVGYLLLWNCDITFMLYAFSLIGCGILSLFLPNL